VGGQPDVVHALGIVRAEARALTASQKHNRNLALGDELQALLIPPLAFAHRFAKTRSRARGHLAVERLQQQWTLSCNASLCLIACCQHLVMQFDLPAAC
jgi:hypothetical protein